MQRGAVQTEVPYRHLSRWNSWGDARFREGGGGLAAKAAALYMSVDGLSIVIFQLFSHHLAGDCASRRLRNI